MVVAGLEVAGALDDQVEAGVEGKLLEEVIVDPGARVHHHAGGAVEAETDGDARLRGRTQVARAPPRRDGDGRRPVEQPRQRLHEQIVVDAVPDRHPDAAVVRAHDEPLVQQPAGELAPVGVRDEEEVGVRGERRQLDCTQGGREPLALLDHRPDVGRPRERGHGERRSEARHGRGRLPSVELGGDVLGGERVANPRTGEPEGLGERAQHDHLVVEQRHGSLAAVLEVGLVADERARVRQRAQRSVGAVRRQANVTTGSSSPISARASCAAIR